MDNDDRLLAEHMLVAVEDSLEERDNTNEFIESLRSQLDARGFLTKNQMRGLQNFYDRID